MSHTDTTLGRRDGGCASDAERQPRHVRLAGYTRYGVEIRVILIWQRDYGQKNKAKLTLRKSIFFQTAIEGFDANPEHTCGHVLIPAHHIQGL